MNEKAALVESRFFVGGFCDSAKKMKKCAVSERILRKIFQKAIEIRAKVCYTTPALRRLGLSSIRRLGFSSILSQTRIIRT